MDEDEYNDSNEQEAFDLSNLAESYDFQKQAAQQTVDPVEQVRENDAYEPWQQAQRQSFDPRQFEIPQQQMRPGQQMPRQFAPPQAPPQQPPVQVPYGQADMLQLQKYTSGLAEVESKVRTRELTEPEGNVYKKWIMDALAPLAQKKQQSEQEAEQGEFQKQMKQAAQQAAIENVNMKTLAEGFQDTVGTFYDQISGTFSHFYQDKSGSWTKIDGGGESAQGGDINANNPAQGELGVAGDQGARGDAGATPAPGPQMPEQVMAGRDAMAQLQQQDAAKMRSGAIQQQGPQRPQAGALPQATPAGGAGQVPEELDQSRLAEDDRLMTDAERMRRYKQEMKKQQKEQTEIEEFSRRAERLIPKIRIPEITSPQMAQHYRQMVAQRQNQVSNLVSHMVQSRDAQQARVHQTKLQAGLMDQEHRRQESAKAQEKEADRQLKREKIEGERSKAKEKGWEPNQGRIESRVKAINAERSRMGEPPLSKEEQAKAFDSAVEEDKENWEKLQKAKEVKASPIPAEARARVDDYLGNKSMMAQMARNALPQEKAKYEAVKILHDANKEGIMDAARIKMMLESGTPEERERAAKIAKAMQIAKDQYKSLLEG